MSIAPEKISHQVAPFWSRRMKKEGDDRLKTAQLVRKESAANYEAQEARYDLFLGILAEKLGISGLNTDREDPSHATVLAEQLETIKKVFDQLFTVSKLLRLSPDQARSFSIFEKNSRSLDFIIPALDPDILSHQDLLAFVNSLKPTVFTSYEQILGIAQINDPANSEGKRQIIAQLMSDLGVNKFSIRKLVKFFEIQPTLAQVRAEMSNKKGKLGRLYWTFATLLGVAAMSISCVPATPEVTSTPPGVPATEVEPTVEYTPSYTLSRQEEIINPNSHLQLETPLNVVEINPDSNFWESFDDNQTALRRRMGQFDWLNNSNYVMTVVVKEGQYKIAAIVTDGGTVDGTLAPGMVVIPTTLPEIEVGNATGYTYGVLPGAETATPEPAKTPEAPTPTVTPTIVVPEEMVGGQLTPEQIAETEQMIIDRNIRGQLDQLGIHVNIIGIDETVSDPTGEYAVKRLGDWLALEKITAEEDGSRSYILFNHNNGEVAEVMVKKNEYVTISPDGNWVVLNADGQPAQEIEWQKVASEEAPQPEGEHQLIAINRSLSIKFFVDQSAPEISDPAELERFTKLRDFLPELLEIRGELAFRVNEYLGVNFGEADLLKMHLSLERNGSNFELILHDARTGEDQEVNLGTISADENFIYIDVGNGPEQMAQHPREYKTTYAGAEFIIRHVVSWPGQEVTINPELVIQFICEAIKLNPDLHTHLGRTEPFSSPEEVVQFYLDKQSRGEEMLIPISVHSGEINGRYNDVLLVPGNPFDINIYSFEAVSSDVLAYFYKSSTINRDIRAYIDNINGKWTIFYADTGDFDNYKDRLDDTATDDPEMARLIKNSEARTIGSGAINPLYRTPVGPNKGLRSQDIPPNSTPDSLRSIIQQSDFITREK